jgi:Alpha/beta hydrolase domain
VLRRRLAGLYPTSAAYVQRFRGAADQAVDAGFLLPEDADMLTAAATASPPVAWEPCRGWGPQGEAPPALARGRPFSRPS